jgi:hypothetical protein
MADIGFGNEVHESQPCSKVGQYLFLASFSKLRGINRLMFSTRMTIMSPENGLTVASARSVTLRVA